MGSVHFMGVFGRNARPKNGLAGWNCLQNSGKELEKTACITSPQKNRNFNGRRQTGIFYSERDLKCTGPIKFTGP